jgi:starch-binding outer membrane protein, SusD/RagB family
MYRGREAKFFYAEEGSSVLPGIDSRESSIRSDMSSPTGYTLYKYMDESIDMRTTSSSVPWIIFRLAEAYLNYAEAQFHLGNEGVAREYVNKVRARANMPDIISTGNKLLEDIRHERRIELVFENYHRFCDVRRWEIVDKIMGKDVGQMKIFKNDDGNLRYERGIYRERTFHPKSYNFPIPLSEIEKAPWLKQNSCY